MTLSCARQSDSTIDSTTVVFVIRLESLKVRWFRPAYLLFAFGLLSILMPTSVFAAATVSVTPARIVLSLQPTQVVTQPVTVRNDGDSELRIFAEFRDMRTAIDDRKVMEFAAGGTQPDSVADWLTAVPQRFALAPGAVETVMLEIRSDSTDLPGSYQGAVFFVGQTQADLEGSSVMLSPEVGSVLQVTLVAPETRIASFVREAFSTNTWNLVGLVAFGLGGGMLLGLEFAILRKRKR